MVKSLKLQLNIFSFYTRIKKWTSHWCEWSKNLGNSENIKEGDTISVLLEKIEDKNDVIVSALKAR